jgi:hypothetical protein
MGKSVNQTGRPCHRAGSLVLAAQRRETAMLPDEPIALRYFFV